MPDPQPTDAELKAILNEAGTPNPKDFRVARPLAPKFKDGIVLSATVAVTAFTPIAGALLVRVRGKFTHGGTLSFSYRRSPPNQGTAYTAAPPCTDVTVVANTEFSQDINPGGESILAIKWTPDGVNAATVTFFDIMQQ